MNQFYYFYVKEVIEIVFGLRFGQKKIGDFKKSPFFISSDCQ